MLFCTADSIQERQHFSSLIEYSNVSRAPTVCVCVCVFVLYITLTLYLCVTCKVKVLLTDALKMLCHASPSACASYISRLCCASLILCSLNHISTTVHPAFFFFFFFSFSVLLVHFYVIYESNA